MRVALFDWAAIGGHHHVYLERFAQALAGEAEVVIAAPDDAVARLAGAPAELVGLGEARPDVGSRISRRRLRVLDREIALLREVAGEVDRVVHLYADNVIALLARTARLPAPTSVLLFYPRTHYPSAYGSRLRPAERLVARGKDAIVARWRRRPDAHSLLLLDEELTRRMARLRGAPAHWLPEPPVRQLAARPARREGCIVYGALSSGKGLDRLARAVAVDGHGVVVTLAGEVVDDYRDELTRLVADLRASGAHVDLRARRHDELEGLAALASARCAVLAYPRHHGMSRVLVEACSVGTPVVVHDWGLLAHLVRRWGIGRVVDCRDPRALREALADVGGPGAQERFAPALARFSAHYSADAFKRALLAAVLPQERQPSGRPARIEPAPGGAA